MLLYHYTVICLIIICILIRLKVTPRQKGKAKRKFCLIIFLRIFNLAFFFFSWGNYGIFSVPSLTFSFSSHLLFCSRERDRTHIFTLGRVFTGRNALRESDLQWSSGARAWPAWQKQKVTAFQSELWLHSVWLLPKQGSRVKKGIRSAIWY